MSDTPNAKYQDPPLNRGHWFLGNLLELQKNPLTLFEDAIKENGDFVRFRFGPAFCYLITHPDFIQDFFKVNPDNYIKKSRGYDYIKKGIGAGLFAGEGVKQRQERQLAQPEFTASKISMLYGPMNEAIDKFIQRWASFAKENKIVDLHKEMGRITLSVVDSTLLKAGLTDDELDHVIESMSFSDHYIAERTRKMFNVPYFIKNRKNDRFRHVLKGLKDIGERIIRVRLKTRGQHNDIIEKLIESYNLDDDQLIKCKNLRQQILTYVVSGHETTALAMTWNLYLIAQHQDVEKRVHEEAKQANCQSATDLDKLKYINIVFRETLRLYPPGWQLARRSVEGDDIKGFRIKPGRTVIVSPYITQRHPEFWSKPNEFIPERAEYANDLHPFAYFPFGGGARRCIGNHFALQEIKMIISQVISKFRLQVLNIKSIDCNPLVSLPPREPIIVKLSIR